VCCFMDLLNHRLKSVVVSSRDYHVVMNRFLIFMYSIFRLNSGELALEEH
jgi:hypothetical protein